MIVLLVNIFVVRGSKKTIFLSKIIVRGKIFVLRAKELFVWSPMFKDNTEVAFCSDDESLKEDDELSVDSNNHVDPDVESDVEDVSDTVFRDQDDKLGHEQALIQSPKDKELSSDTFNLYDLLNKQDKGETKSGLEDIVSDHDKSKCCSDGFSSCIVEDDQPLNEQLSSDSPDVEHGYKKGGSVLEVLDDMIKIGQTMGFSMEGCKKDMQNIIGSKANNDWIKELNVKHKVNFLSIQETKMDGISDMDVKLLWGNYKFEYIFSEAVGYSGGILSVWDPSVFRKKQHIISNNFVALYGSWIPNKVKVLMISIYAPQSLTCKRLLWSYISSLISRWNGECMFMGDFNKVRYLEERMGSMFNAQGGSAFSNFISNSRLVEIQFEGFSFTWSYSSATKMSKLDCFLVFEGLVSLFRRLSGICLDRHLSDHKPILLREVIELECPVTKEEIKRAVWDCGENKSPGPDGYTFEFFRKFWDTTGSDLCVAVEWFFEHSSFTKGCNSSFIALIPKTHDPKWDYLGDVLQAFGFGSKWCSWISGCLHSGMASVLLNGSPTSKFQFQCGLKQGDPLAPYLFILISESLHLSFSRAVDAGIFKGIQIGYSFNISHLFYANDEIFIGEWSSANLLGITRILHCFSLLSGLKINLIKSQILGIGISNDIVAAVALTLRCSVLKTPFKYLGVMVGGNNSTTQAWDDMINKLKAWLSNWKLKTLFVGGRLTLLKSVLGSSPIYTMSIYKINKGCTMAEKLQNPVTLSLRRTIRLGVEASQLDHLIKTVEATILTNLEDRWVWDLNGEGVFRVKDARSLLDDCFLPKDPIATRWVKFIPIKIDVFAWKVFLDRLPTCLNLSTRGIHVPDLLCPICKSTWEDSSHVFFSCSLIREVVSLVCRWWNLTWSPSVRIRIGCLGSIRSDYALLQKGCWKGFSISRGGVFGCLGISCFLRRPIPVKMLFLMISFHARLLGVILDVIVLLVGIVGVNILIYFPCNFVLASC
nr:RNA-directed DNA polymerase, eukaryota [Tanacetum cinerariifolium]